MKSIWSRRSLFLSSLFFVMLFFGFQPDRSAIASGMDASDRAGLQLALRQHLSDNTVDGRYRYFDANSGETRLLQLKFVHPDMFEKDGFFLLCADFVGSDHKEVILDYVIRESGGGYRIDQIIQGRRSFLMQVFERIL